MKKNLILWACAAAALLFIACQKEKTPSEVPSTEDPADVVVPAGDMGVITATAMDTKTITPDGVKVYWENNDEIKLYTRIWNESTEKFDAGFCSYKTALTSPSASASFVKDESDTKTPDNSSSKFFAVHVKGAVIQTQSREYYAQLTLNKEQVAKNGGDFASTILYSVSAGSAFTFSHSTAYLKFTVDNNTTAFRKLTVSPVNESEYIVSRHQVTFTGGAASAAVLATNPSSGAAYSQSSKTVSVTTDDAADFGAGTYYLAINPGTYSDGFKLVFENSSSQEVSVNTPTNVVLAAGEVANIGTIGTLNFTASTAFEPYLYKESGVNKGVVFWVDPTDPTKGKAVSGAYTTAVWHASTQTFDDAASFDTDDSQANHNYIMGKSDYSATNYPAVAYCVSLGTGWRLPSKEEFDDLIRAWCGHTGAFVDNTSYTSSEAAQAAITKFDALLDQCSEGSKLAVNGTSSANWYWTGQASSSDKKIRRTKIASTYYPGTAKATGSNLVRCVRDIQIP